MYSSFAHWKLRHRKLPFQRIRIHGQRRSLYWTKKCLQRSWTFLLLPKNQRKSEFYLIPSITQHWVNFNYFFAQHLAITLWTKNWPEKFIFFFWLCGRKICGKSKFWQILNLRYRRYFTFFSAQHSSYIPTFSTGAVLFLLYLSKNYSAADFETVFGIPKTSSWRAVQNCYHLRLRKKFKLQNSWLFSYSPYINFN